MNSKQRVIAALEHREADRVPLDIGGMNNSTMHYLVQQDLYKALGLPDNGAFVRSYNQRVVLVDDSIQDYFGGDTCSIYMDDTHPWIDNGDGTFTDMWGIRYRLNPDEYYYNMISHPLEEAEEPEDLLAYDLPVPNEAMLAGLSERLDAHADKFCILEGFRECMFGLPSWLRGVENFYCDLIVNEALSDALHEKLLAFYFQWIDFVMPRIGDRIDIVKFADDMGAQNALLMSPATYRARIKPYQARLYDYVKTKYHKKVLLHSCGAIRSILGDLIDIGVDAINPVQISAADMEPASLKKEFGDRITFWGGGVDTQHTLNAGTPAHVRDEVRHNLEIFKPGGGYVFTQVHNIQPGVPIENVIAMYEAFREFSRYN